MKKDYQIKVSYKYYNSLWRLIHKLEKKLMSKTVHPLTLSDIHIIRMKIFGTDRGLFKTSKTAKPSRTIGVKEKV